MAGDQRQAVPAPEFRYLRVFPIDPGVAAAFETGALNEEVLRIPWEKLDPGPSGEYVTVVDEDENGTRLNDPIDLDRPEILAQRGLTPSDGDQQFHQQMVYAVAMRTIDNFERALGRRAQWAPVRDGKGHDVFCPRLALYPHAMADANAYYISAGEGLRYGYFEAGPGSLSPGTCVFSCLSQDVTAHEVSHALVDGMRIVIDDESGDVLGFHEGFATIVSLFQHFRIGDVLRQQVAAVRGDLSEPNLLGVIAPQFGRGLGMRDGLSTAFAATDERGAPSKERDDAALYRNVREPHALGGILVAAVFGAFRKIYDSRVADLRRIASKGTGILPPGDVHPDLVDRFMREAGTSAGHVLDMCIRALDYLPPVGFTFGDYLRAILTADHDLFPIDERRYRLAFVDAFRSHGIQPSGLTTVSVDTLVWPEPEGGGAAPVVSDFVKSLAGDHTYWNLPRKRDELWTLLDGWKRQLKERLDEAAASAETHRLGPVNLKRPFEVASFDLRARAGYEGELTFQWVVKIVQRSAKGNPTAGTTLLVDAETGDVRFQIEGRAARKGGGGAKAPSVLERSRRTSSRAPRVRRLRVFAFDPSLGVQLETAGINEVVLEVPWEPGLKPGPIGEYLEVVDRDPASRCFYEPIDLADPAIIAADGLTPSESNPQFHQQMVYAVAMRTIRNFERALGRLALWSPKREKSVDAQGKEVWKDDLYVQHLRLHPHALREANAYYSPDKKAVLFGYFPAPVAEDAPVSTRLTVFTSVSHDIVAHEVTHALLDGIHRRFREPSNADVLAFHEAFADVVALFQHFSLPGVLRNQIAETRGDLGSQNRLGELAQQFGEATGKRGALRSAIGQIDPETHQWKPLEPHPEAYAREMEPHARGAILVAAIFDAFLTIYKSRIADLLRIATEGTGVLPAGQLHPDLVDRLADEAAGAAVEVLDMCIRALDYCPPVDLTFGDYLRAVVTADFESDPVDEGHRRVAFVEAFRRRGIVPEDIRTLSADGLLWRPAAEAPDEDEKVVVGLVKRWAVDISSWNLSKSREELFDLMTKRRRQLHGYLERKIERREWVPSALDLSLPIEVHSIRPSTRVDRSGRPHFQWVIELTQRQPLVDAAGAGDGAVKDYFRGGCTLLVDAETGEIRYSIRKKLDDARRSRQRRYVERVASAGLAATYFGSVARAAEPFAMLHRLPS